MTIEIHQPELEALIRQQMASGAFRNVDDLLAKALGALDKPVFAGPHGSEAQNFVDLSEPVRGLLSDKEVDTLFRRTSSVSRPSIWHERVSSRHQHPVANAAARS